MSRTYKDEAGKAKSGSTRRDRHVSARAVRREQPDLRKLARAVIQLAMAEAEADAQRATPPTKAPVVPSNGAVRAEELDR